MATPVTISLPALEQLHFSRAFEIFKIVDQQLSSYREDSDIARLNKAKTAEISPGTLKALKRALHLAEQTDGLFDPTIGALTLKVYGFGSGHPRIPTPREIEKAQKSVDYKKVLIQGSKVRIQADTHLDLGGMGKGYAVDWVVD